MRQETKRQSVMVTFKKLLAAVKSGLLKPLVWCSLRRHREDERPRRAGEGSVRREMDEEEVRTMTTTGVDSELPIIANAYQNQNPVEIRTEGDDEDHLTPPPVAQLPQQSSPRPPSNIVCIMPNSDLGIQFAEAIRALSPLKTDVDNVTATRQLASPPDEIPVASNPPTPPALPESLKPSIVPRPVARLAIYSRPPKRVSEPKSVFRFLDLPAEIRQMVYQIHFESQDINVTRFPKVAQKNWNGTSGFLPSKMVVQISASTIQLRYVCRQLYDEASAAMLNYSNFDLIRGTTGWTKFNGWTLTPEIILTMRKFSCNNANFARLMWTVKRMCEGEETSDSKFREHYQPKPGSNFQIGSLIHQGFTVNRLKEIALYTSGNLFRGLTLPQWVTEKWYCDEDQNNRRVFEIVEIRQLLEDFEKYATHAFRLRLRSAKQAFKYREIELTANGSVIVRGVPNVWHELAERRIRQWLQLPRGRTIKFEDSTYHAGSKAVIPKVGRS